MRRFLLGWFMLFMTSACVYAQSTISGFVYNETGEPLPGANVTITTSIGASTDLSGYYKFEAPVGNHTITVSYIGYEKVNRLINMTEADQTLDFRLAASSVELSDITITSNSTENIQKITNYDLSQRPVKNSQEILRMIPGLFIAQHAGGGKAEQIFLRGFDIDHGTDINLSVDGLPVNMVSHAHGQGYSDLHFVIPETINKITFDKGPYQVQKGDFATAGYAEFATYDYLKQSSAKLEVGQFGMLRSVAMIDLLKKNKEKQSAYIAGEVFLSDGYFESEQNFSRINFMGKYNNQLTKNSKLTFTLSNFSSEWDASGQIPERAVENGLISRFGAIDDTEGGKTSRTNASLKLTQDLDNSATVTNQLYFVDYNFNLISNFTFFLNDPVNGDQITQSESRQIYGYNGTYETDHNFGNVSLLSSFGASIRYDNIQDIRLSSTLNRTTVLDDKARGDIKQANFSLWAGETLEIGKNVALNFSSRFDHFTFSYRDALANVGLQKITQNVISPKMQLNFKFNDNISIFAKTGIGFHSNDSRVVVAQNGTEILPKAYGFDLGTMYKPAANVVVHATLWALNLDQEFVYVGDEGIVEPSGKTTRRGIDLSLRHDINEHWHIDTDFTFTDAKSVEASDNNDYIPLAPQLTSIGGLTYKSHNGLSGGVRFRYLGPRPANEDYSVTAEGYFLLDANVTYKNSNCEIALSAENLFNQDWNEAQFLTTSRLRNEMDPVSEIHFTPGAPLFIKAGFSIFF